MLWVLDRTRLQSLADALNRTAQQKGADITTRFAVSPDASCLQYWVTLQGRTTAVNVVVSEIPDEYHLHLPSRKTVCVPKKSLEDADGAPARSA